MSGELKAGPYVSLTILFQSCFLPSSPPRFAQLPTPLTKLDPTSTTGEILHQTQYTRSRPIAVAVIAARRCSTRARRCKPRTGITDSLESSPSCRGYKIMSNLIHGIRYVSNNTCTDTRVSMLDISSRTTRSVDLERLQIAT